jgi:hypothetical protein
VDFRKPTYELQNGSTFAIRGGSLIATTVCLQRSSSHISSDDIVPVRESQKLSNCQCIPVQESCIPGLRALQQCLARLFSFARHALQLLPIPGWIALSGIPSAPCRLRSRSAKNKITSLASVATEVHVLRSRRLYLPN